MSSISIRSQDGDGTGTPGRRRRPGRGHFLDYIRIVRSHWMLALGVFLVVFGLRIADALVAEPTYEARATIQVERGMGGQDMPFSPLVTFNMTLVTAAELEVLRSFPVAMLAAQDAHSGAVASIQELNEYRPLETALRSFRDGWRACPLDVLARPLDRGAATIHLQFGPEGKTIKALLAGGREVAHFAEDDWAFGESYTDTNENYKWDRTEDFQDRDDDGLYDPGKALKIHNDEILLVRGESTADPSGRTYVLTRRSLAKGAHWLQKGAVAREVSEYTGILSIGFVASSPVGAARAANALALAYQKYKERKQKEEVERRITWLGREVGKVKADLEALERTRDAYVARKGGSVLLGEEANALLAQQRELDQRRAALEVQLRMLDWQITELDEEGSLDQKLLVLRLDTVDAKTSALASELTQLETSLDVLMALERGTEENPKVRELNARIEQIEIRLKDRVDDLVTRQKELLQLERDSAQKELDDLRLKYGEIQTSREALPAKEREFIRLNRPIEIHEELFNYLTKTKMESEMTRESIVSRVHVLDPAVRPTVRQSPKVASTGVLAIVLGILAALGAVFLREYMIRTLTSPQVLEDDLGLRVYAAIPNYLTVRRRERKGVGRRRAMVTIHAPNSVLAEAYRTLRANIKFTNAGDAPKTLAITSALEQEGKSVTTLNLAVVMAQAGDRVLVVDADMRRPSTHIHLPGPSQPGLVDVLRGEVAWRDVVTEKEVPGLHVIHAGRPPKNPSALLDSKAFSEFLEEIKQAYDYVLFDVPPVLAVADASAFFRELDGILLLTRYRRCTVDTIDGALDQIERLGGSVMGVVFNGFDARASARRGYGYYGYYGYYSRRYGGYRSAEQHADEAKTAGS